MDVLNAQRNNASQAAPFTDGRPVLEIPAVQEEHQKEEIEKVVRELQHLKVCDFCKFSSQVNTVLLLLSFQTTVLRMKVTIGFLAILIIVILWCVIPCKT